MLKSGESCMSDILQETKPTSLALTASGAHVDIDDVGAADIRLYDIGYGLSHATRWSGQFGDCNVAQHSALVTYLTSEMLPKELPQDIRENALRFALLHDASEAYIGEVPVHIKRRCREYCDIEEALMNRIYNVLGVYNDYPAHEEVARVVKIADAMATVIERAVFHRLKLTQTPKRVNTASGDYVTAYTKKINDLLRIHLAYRGYYATCPIGKTWKMRIPSWGWYVIDLFGDFSI